MIGRNKNWSGQSDWIKEFNKVHNPGLYYEEKKQKKIHNVDLNNGQKNKKEIKKKNQKQKNYPFKYKIFRQQD
jgi:hypothetical protein